MELVPDAGSTPFVQAVPKGHAAATHLVGKILPGDAGLEHEQNACETDAIRHAWFADSWNEWMLGKNWLDQLPQLVRHQQLAHRVLLDSDVSYFAQKLQAWERLFLEALNTGSFTSFIFLQKYSHISVSIFSLHHL